MTENRSPNRWAVLVAWALNARQASMLMLAGVALTLGGAWFIQLSLGIQPCPLCLEQRIPYYIAIPLLALLAVTLGQEKTAVTRLTLLWLMIITAFVSAGGLGAYHAGVEWGFWKGPSDCSGDFKPAGLDQLMSQLNSVKIIRCDAVALRIFGLSLAAWNTLIASSLAVFATLALRRWLRQHRTR